jgi:hypothetical protein
MTDFIVEKIIRPIRAWQYDGTGRATWNEDRSTWPVWLRNEVRYLRFSNGGHLFYHYVGEVRTMVNKGDFLVIDGDQILHFDSVEAFDKRYRRVAA